MGDSQVTIGSAPGRFDVSGQPESRPEHELLLLCARSVLRREHAERIRALASEDVDWVGLCRLASRHHVAPLVSWQLEATCGDSVPPFARAQLRSEFQVGSARSLQLAAELLRLLEIFRTAAIRAVPYKGPALAMQAFGNLALRQYDDLDLVISQADVSRAQEALVNQGYQPAVDLRNSRHAQKAGHPGQYFLYRESDDVIVELHTPLTMRYFPNRIDLDRLCTRLESISLGGGSVETFSVEDLLPMLCVHGSKHFWDRLSWVCDIAELAQAERRIDWEKSFEEAQRLGARSMLLLGFHLSRELLGAELPQGILERLKKDRPARTLGEDVSRRFSSNVITERGLLERLRFRIRMRGDAWRGLAYSLRLATQPTEADWDMVRLPGALAPMYRAVRLWRLWKQYGSRLSRRG
jgi:hypothetical protein